MKIIEYKLNHCGKCAKETTHKRNNHRSGILVTLINIALVIATGGIWLLVWAAFAVLTARVGGWKCSECVTVGILHKKIF